MLPSGSASTTVRWVAVLWVGLCLVKTGRAGEAPSPVAPDYLRDIKPLLTKRCYACHGALKRQAGLRLDTAAFLREGGDGGPAIVPGKSDESLIVEVVSGEEARRMPPEGEGTPLSPQEIATVRAWIDQGARSPETEAPQPDPRKHWSFAAPVRPALPPRTGFEARWVRTPIDAFLAQRHQQEGLRPRPTAAPGELIRRLYLDLIGLVPTPREVQAFTADPSDRAYEEIVDRLLASPQYGERWGRHWMDVWRYSDWDGFGAEIRESQPHIWRWRDWIVESLNRDAGYNTMIVQMLAADEASPEDTSALRATGYLVRNWYKFNRNAWLDTTIEHTAKAFLGLTINCARCHDHKYDPVGQAEYYRFRAFFEPHNTRTDRIPGQPDSSKDGLVRVFDSEPQTKTYLFTRGDEKRPVKERPLDPGIPQVLAKQDPLPPIQAVALPPTAYYQGLNAWVREETLTQARAELAARERAMAQVVAAQAPGKPPESPLKARNDKELACQALRAAQSALASIEHRIAADQARFATPPAADAPVLARKAAKAERAAGFQKAEHALFQSELALADAERALQAAKDKAVDAARKGVTDARAKRDTARKDLKTRREALALADANYSPLTPIHPATSTGRRLALARWIANRKNPLTARVAINHIWMRHFGTPLVPTEFDFGVNGKPPSHPALLDWLAVELMENGWKMKPIHRLMVTSNAYRMQSTAGFGDPNLAIDPANREYWRMNPRRMEAEVVRDNLFRVAGNLDMTMGGPDLDPETGLTLNRRSLYFRHTKEKRVTFLRLFDSSNVLSCYRRSESIVPQQALALANSPLGASQARRLAQSIIADLPAGPAGPAAPSVEAFVSLAFERILGRNPTSDELAECRQFLAKQTERLADGSRLAPFAKGPAPGVLPSSDPAQRAREGLVHVLLNHNDFVTIR